MIEIEKYSNPDTVSMHEDWFEIADENHFWMQWRWAKLKQLKKLFLKDKSHLLEVGCGNGIVVDQIESETNCIVDGCDLNQAAMQISKPSKGKKYLYNIYDKNPLFINKYDGIILLDVLEHITDPIDFLSVANLSGKNNSSVIINVPAYQWLYSNYDLFVGHIKRYNKKDVEKLMLASNLEIIKIQYWGALLIPIALLRKILIANKREDVIKSGFKPPGKLADYFLRALMKFELALPFSLPFGTSLIAIGRIKQK